MTWRAMNSLLVLRDQVNAIAPDRSRASDGLVGDLAHQAETSDHNPHPVAGVGDEMVTALDLTHDPANGFDSYLFAEILRVHRDPRIKYVISNHRIFSSYSNSSRAAWTWGDYTGTDPHTNHVHVSVLDAVISDTKTPWNLEGFAVTTQDDVIVATTGLWDHAANRDTPTGRNFGNDVIAVFQQAAQARFDGLVTQVNELSSALAEQATALSQIQAKLDELLAKQGTVNSFTFPAASTFSTGGTIIWNPPEQ